MKCPDVTFKSLSIWCLQHTFMCCRPLLQISCNRGLISPAQRDRVFSVMRALQLPMKHEVCNTKLYMKVRRMIMTSGVQGA